MKKNKSYQTLSSRDNYRPFGKAEIIIVVSDSLSALKAQRRRRDIIEPTLEASASEVVKGG